MLLGFGTLLVLLDVLEEVLVRPLADLVAQHLPIMQHTIIRKMKRSQLLFLSFFLFIGLSLSAQPGQVDLRNSFNEYFKTVQEMDAEKTMEYMYPPLFEIFPKDMLIAAFNQIKEDPTTVISFGESTISHISPSVTDKKVKYHLIDYSYDMSMVMKMEEEEESADSLATENEIDFDMNQFMLEMLEAQFGKGNVEYTPEENKYVIFTEGEMYAIKDPEYDGWKFLEKKKEMMDTMEKILPKKVLKKL